MSYVITFTGRRGSTRTMRLDLGSEKTARAFCTDFAKRMRTVVLHEEDNGVSTAIGRWESGHAKRNFTAPPGPRIRTVVIEGEVELPADYHPQPVDEDAIDVSVPLDDQLDDGGEVESAAIEDDEAHNFEGQCMKCRTKRAFVGRVKELSNGSRQAQGSCPVCGTTIVRMVSRSTPLDEWGDDAPAQSDSDTPERPEGEDENVLADSEAAQEYLDAEAETPDTTDHVLIRENRGRNTTFTCSAGDWQMKTRSKGAETQAIAEFEAHRAEAEPDDAEADNEIQTEISEAVAEAVPEGTPVEDVAAATATLAMEFSEAADDTEVAKPAPRKRGGKKAKTDTVDADAAAVANLETAKCAQCGQMVPVKVSGDGSLRYLMVHPDGKGNPECRGSRTTLD